MRFVKVFHSEMPDFIVCIPEEVEDVDAFLDSVGKVNGKAKAKRALKYVIDGSLSPMETMVYMLLCLPVMLGGYGLPKPEMNSIIELDEEKSKEYNKIIVKKAILIDKYKKICFRPTLGQRIKKVFQLNRINKKEKLICDYFLK